ncbi:MAG TPA: DUF2252 domain-containing protein, partial [Acidimicrobiia bacterium]|nr:DUF2252 domain-containing protein [Acidimicrobiia bacterium]
MAEAAVATDVAKAMHHPELDERVRVGRAARAAVPRSAHAACPQDPDRPDPIGILHAQEADRV